MIPKVATVTTPNMLLPMAKEPTAQHSMMMGMMLERGARSTWLASRIMMMPSGIMMMLAMMNIR